jgi:hypothetical protein
LNVLLLRLQRREGLRIDRNQAADESAGVDSAKAQSGKIDTVRHASCPVVGLRVFSLYEVQRAPSLERADGARSVTIRVTAGA